MTGVALLFSLWMFSIRLSRSFPHYKYDDMDEDLASFDYYKAMDEFEYKNGTACDECVSELCPVTQGCRAGLVKDNCGCCFECGNLEGQSCDVGERSVYYGLCGEDMACKLEPLTAEDGEIREPQCVCIAQSTLCGSDGQTYMNLCKFKEAAFSNPGLNASDGPCKTVPVIKVPPRNLVNVTGSSSLFLCEVFAFPMAQVEWRKDGDEVVLPGDDPHISVQSRGGPQKFELSSWLQIEETTRSDSGTYRCVAKNDLGEASASAVLGILPPDEMTAYLKENIKEVTEYDQGRYYDDYY